MPPSPDAPPDAPPDTWTDLTPGEPVNVLLFGSGGREHALGEAIASSPRCGTLFLANPGNPALDAIGRPVTGVVDIRQAYRLRQFADRERIGLVVIGPEDPLADGWADALSRTDAGQPRAVFGPGKAGARLEADKAWAKQVMREAMIPTAEGRSFTDFERARAFLESRRDPQVIKAAGLAKGKGVIVPETPEDAMRALHAIMVDRAFGDAGSAVVIEERLAGDEISVLALTDGDSLMLLPLCRDHKRLLDGGAGPNTGGMGAFSPVHDLPDGLIETVEAEVLVPLLDTLRREEIPYRGVIYAGLMLTHAGPRTLEFNCRFGDPECQTILARIASDPLDLLIATATGTLADAEPRWATDAAVTVVLAADGYPDRPRTGDPIDGLDEAGAMPGVRVHHAGTRLAPNGSIVTAGGRILAVTATAPDLATARANAYDAAGRIHFDGRQMRSDIASGA